MKLVTNEEEIKQLVLANPHFKQILGIIEELQLADCWLCAGTIRNFIWNYLSGKEELDQSNDVDVIFFDPMISYEETSQLERELKKAHPQFNWELKNEVYMHMHNPDTAPYKSTYDALAKFPETCTAIAIRLKDGQVELIAPHGVADLLQFIVAATPHFKTSTTRKKIYQERVQQKNWQARWSQIQLMDMAEE
ncbi:hypothetical protein BAU15_14525 [Enterococcus sp. JM4C]|uniref:nucleotidyltransferase family protein n=1 Tax=Candidatus Enterococcus huntleyi TaxID=1857217 RepID=UPI00137AABAA|nr:nucleotidyltransferase family protein [Enterococcus sp. JM4C]KAF1296914.1 hypothetical protein BAU15_14525 [Enterococcus sp. JM4C]